MPLTRIQLDILALIASQRDFNRDSPRLSGDIDIFQDRAERVAQAANTDAAILKANGYLVEWLRQAPYIYSALVVLDRESTKLEWVSDSDFRFFPTMRDKTFGFILHPADMAMNKVQAAAGRRELRDLVDVLTIHQRILPLGAVVWAAVEKMPGFTPEGLLAEIRRNSNYPREDWKRLASTEPMDPLVIMPQLRAVFDEADAFISAMPSEKGGVLFLENGKVVQPDPAHLDRYQTHAGSRKGHWPTNSEIESAMLEWHYQHPQTNS